MRVFLSSTFVDLAQIRAEIAKWLSGVFGAELVIMESFGSEAIPPDINSVRRVRECDIFVGIYARRYGTVDDTSGKSITELELDEAKNALSSGVVRTILLYLLSAEASWLPPLEETSPEARVRLTGLFEKARQHTCTYFARAEELPFLVVRDVYRQLQSRTQTTTRRLRDVSLPVPRQVKQPLGMEFLTSADRQYLAGRARQVDEFINLLDENHISLLLGESGIGKTSLLHAGLVPSLPKTWRAVYTRPLGLPGSDIVTQLQTSVFEGAPLYKGSLPPLLAEVSAAVNDDIFLLIIDQFEDVLAARDDREVEQLVQDLRVIPDVQSTRIRILISYRSDLEGRLGKFWQEISGSPLGLPRLYLGGIDAADAWGVVKKIVQDLSITIDLSDSEESSIKSDLGLASHILGLTNLYPPYVQILIDHFWSICHERATGYTFADYRQAGGIEAILGNYLTRVLSYAKDSRGDLQALLVALVRSYGSKRQVAIEEIAGETGRSVKACEAGLEKLIDFRLVRHIGDYYEVAHDFIARKVLFAMVDSDELNFKRFRELLASKAAAYATTRNLLTTQELLALYAYRDRVLPNELELRLLVESWLDRAGPALFWIMKADPSQVLMWLSGSGSGSDDGETDTLVLAALLKRRLTNQQITSEELGLFRGYKLAVELAGLISEAPRFIPEKLLHYGLRHRRGEVRNASLQAVIQQLCNGDWSWIDRLERSSSIPLSRAYRELVCDRSIPSPPAESNNLAIQRFSILQKLARSRLPKKTTEQSVSDLIKLRAPKRMLLFAKALIMGRQEHIAELVRLCQRSNATVCDICMSAMGAGVTDRDFEVLIQTYVAWNAQETEKRRALSRKANAAAKAIFRTTTEARIPELFTYLERINLFWSSREVIAALLKYANAEVLEHILHKIAHSEYEVDYWNHTELGNILEKRLLSTPQGIPSFLLNIAKTEEFWTYVEKKDKRGSTERIFLPIKNPGNRPLFIRLAGYALLGFATKADTDLLLRLATHEYGLIARSAAKRLVGFFGTEALAMLTSRIDEGIQEEKTKSIANAIAAAEMEIFAVIPQETDSNRKIATSAMV